MMNLATNEILVYVVIGCITWIEWVITSTIYLSVVMGERASFMKVFKVTIIDDLKFDNQHVIKCVIRWTWFILWPIGVIRNGIRMMVTAKNLLKEKQLSEL